MQSVSHCNKRTGRYSPVDITRFRALRRGPSMQIWEFSTLSKAMVPPVHQSNVYIKRQLWVLRTQKWNCFLCAISAPGVMTQQITRFRAQCIGLSMQIWEFSTLSKAMITPLHQSNVYIKWQLWVWRTQTCNRFLGAINARGVTARQIPWFRASRIGPRMQIWEFWTLSKAMSPSLHQSKVYIKRQLWVWRTKKCNRVLGAINARGVKAGK